MAPMAYECRVAAVMIRRTIDSLTLVAVVSGAIASATIAWPASAGERGLLWRVVQTCVANHTLTGASFPCLDVDVASGREDGFAVLRAPLEKTHIIVVPTVRTIGIEAERLREPSAPGYFHDAWIARHFVTDDLPSKPTRPDLAMAVNSRLGRSQDQLHIHVNCLKPEVRRALAQRTAGGQTALGTKTWARMTVLSHAPRYWALDVQSEDLAGINVFQMVAAGLKIDPDDMDDMTIVVAGAADVGGKPGFTILARQRQPGTFDEAHGEALLDHECRAFQSERPN